MDNKPWGADNDSSAPYNQPIEGYCVNCGGKFYLEDIVSTDDGVFCSECYEYLFGDDEEIENGAT